MGEDLQSSDFAALLLTHRAGLVIYPIKGLRRTSVAKEGLEPPRLSTSVSKTDVCCHFTTWLLIDRLLLLVLSDLRLPVISSTRYYYSLSTNPKGVPLALVFVCLIAV